MVGAHNRGHAPRDGRAPTWVTATDCIDQIPPESTSSASSAIHPLIAVPLRPSPMWGPVRDIFRVLDVLSLSLSLPLFVVF